MNPQTDSAFIEDALTGQRLVVDAASADGILAQFRTANPVDRPRTAAMNDVMIDWLKRCQAQGWNLVVERDSLLDALERKLRTPQELK